MERLRHTIVLAQFTRSKSTRSYIDYESIAQALDGICQLYEQGLKQQNPSGISRFTKEFGVQI